MDLQTKGKDLGQTNFIPCEGNDILQEVGNTSKVQMHLTLSWKNGSKCISTTKMNLRLSWWH